MGKRQACPILLRITLMETLRCNTEHLLAISAHCLPFLLQVVSVTSQLVGGYWQQLVEIHDWC